MRFLRQTLLSVCLILPCAFAMAQAPTTEVDNFGGDEDSDIIIYILDNDEPGGSAFDLSSIDLDPGGTPDVERIVAEGTFSVDPLGVVTFEPISNFSGAVTPITYTVRNVNNELSDPAAINVTVNAVNDLPIITPLGPQSVDEEGTLGPITLAITDSDNTIASLQLSGSSSNQTLVPNGGITFGTSGPNRTISVVPGANQSGGPVTITITVDDGPGPDVTSTFALTINPINDPPVITALGSQSVGEDGTLGPLTLAITDSDNTIASLQLSGSSSNQTLVPNGGITFGTSGPNRTISVVPGANQSGGPVTITITVDDGPGPDVTSTFDLTINPVNDPPIITALGPQSVDEEGTLGPLTLAITDSDNTIASLQLSGSSSNQTLVPNGGITFGTSGPNRTISVVPGANQSGGPVTITITVDDGPGPDVTSTFPLTINPINDPPVITALGSQSVGEDGTLGPIPLAITDSDNTIASLQLSGSSSNQTLVPNGGITFGTSGPNRTISVVPGANQSGGPVTITITVDDGPGPDVISTFDLTINPVNDPPIITALGPQSVDEEGTLGPLTLAITDSDNTIASLQLSGSSSNQTLVPNGGITFGTSGPNRTISVVPGANQSGGPVTITITVDDGPGPDVTSTFALTINPINDPPVITALGSQSVGEDGTLGPIPLAITDSDNTIASLQLSGSSSNQTLVPNGGITFGTSGPNRTISVVPGANQSGGPVTITITVDDGPGPDVTSTFSLTINPINDPPTASNDNINTNEDTPVSLDVRLNDTDVDGSIASVDLDPTTSGVQTNFTNTAGTWSIVGGAVNYTPVLNYTGPASVSYVVVDNQGGVSNVATFTVAITAVSDPPTISSIDNQTTDEDTPTEALEFTVGDIDNAVGSLTITATSNAQGVIPNASIVIAGTGADRTVTLTPAANQSGLAVITLTVYDGTTNVPMSFAVTVTAISDPPTIASIANQLLDEDESTPPLPFTIADIDNPVSTLTLTRASDNLTLVPISNIVFGGSGANRTVTVTPALDQTGVATITVTVSDGTTLVPTTFQVTVDGFNDAPSISGITNQSTSEDIATPAIPFTVNDPETSAAALTVTASSDNVGIVPNANIVIAGSGANRTVQITPEANQSGAANITLTVSDGPNFTSMSFQVTVNTVDDAPTITTIANQTIAEDAQTNALAFTINDVETPIPNLTVTTSSNNLTLVPLTGIVLGGSGANQTVQVTPAANQFGVAVITVSVDDGDNTTSTNFQVTVSSVNDLPTITAIANQTINEDIATPALSFTITDIETPLASLTVTGSSDNTALIPVANLVFAGTGGTRTVTVTPAANQAGAATVTLTLNDGTNDVPVSFLVTVNPINDAPVITGQTTVSTNEEQAVEIEFSHLTVTDVDNAYPTGFALTVLPNPNYTFVDKTITPNNNVAGNITVRVQISDGALASNIYNLQVAVNPINDPPVITGQSTLTIVEDSPLNFSINNITIVDPDNASGFTFLLGPGSNYSVSGGNIITPDAHFNGALSVPVTVNDGTNSSIPYSLQIQVTPVNDKPQITGQTPISIAEVQPVTIELSQLTVFDPDNDFPDDFTLIVSTGPNYSAVGNVVTPVVNFSGTLLVRVKVFDALLESDFYDFQILVNSTNDPPVITGQRALNTEENEPIEIQFVDLTVSDPDNTYPTGFSLTILPGTTYTFAGTTVTPNPNVTGMIEVRVKVNDGAVDSAPYPLKIDINSVNDAPAITGQQPMSTLEDTPINMSIGFLIISDPDSPPAGFTMAISPGTNYTLNGVEIKPAANFNGTLSVPVTVNDGFLDSQPYNVQVQVTPVNDPPVITAQNPLSTVEDQPITLKLEDFIVTDIDNTFPTGFTLHVTQGSGPNYDVVGNTVTPKPDFTGTLGVTVVIADGVANSNSYSAEIVVGTLNDPPTLDPVSNVTILEDPAQPWATTLTGITAGVGEGTQSVVVTISTNHAEWFDLFEVVYTGGTTAALKIKPKSNVNGTAQVTIRIQDDGVASPLPHMNFFEYTFDFTVDPVNDPPTFTSQPITLAETAQPFEYPIVAVDEEGDPITINVTTMPAWLTLTQISNGNATLSGIPPLGTTGPASIIIEVADPSGVSAVNQNFEVVVNTRPTITPFAISTNEDQTHIFSSEFAANYIDGDGDPLFEIVIKQLPTKGILKFTNGALVTLGAEIPASEINNLTYVPLTDSTGTDIVKWNASDETYYSHLDANIVISVIPFNDPPEIIALEAPESDTLKYELGSEIPVRLTKIFDARDPEGDNIIAAEIGFAVSTEYREDHDKFVFKDTLGIVGSFIESLGVLTLTGKAPVQDYVAAIRSVRYNYIDAKTPEDLANRKVSIRLNDGVFGETKDRLVGLIYTNPGLDIANAFTPNGDVENQYWRIYSPTGLERYKDALIRVYNKRGVLVYEATGFSTPWNGDGLNGALPADSYYYTIDLKYDKKKYKGVVTILR